MALNIRDPEVHRLAREIAETTGETMTEAVNTALRERLARLQQADEAAKQARFEAMMDFASRWRAAPVLDPRPFEDILDYDENGLPR